MIEKNKAKSIVGALQITTNMAPFSGQMFDALLGLKKTHSKLRPYNNLLCQNLFRHAQQEKKRLFEKQHAHDSSAALPL